MGRALLWGQTWSLDSGDGLSGQCVFMTTEGGLLRVENDCAPLSAEALASVTTRFERAGARGPHSGLGLTAAAGIARSMGRALTLRSPLPGAARGFRAEVAVL